MAITFDVSERWGSKGGYREFLLIAFPLILSTGSWSVQHFVDRMFLSWYSSEAIAAAMPAGALNFTIISLFLGTCSYVNIFVAQYYGAGRFDRIGPSLWQGIYLSILGSIILISFAPFSEVIFRVVGHDTLVQEYEVEYFRILCLGGGFIIASSALSGFFSGRGKSWPVMWVNVFATLLNIILDYILIFGKWGMPELGMKGAALATVSSGLFSFIVFLFLISSESYNNKYHTLKGWRFDKILFSNLLRFGFPAGVQFLLDMSGFTIFILLVGRLGTTSLAATSIAFNISTLTFMPMIGAGIAASVLVGQYLGRNMPDLAQKSVYSGFHLTFAYMAGFSIAYVIVPDIFITPFSAHADSVRFAEIYKIAVILLRFVAIYSIFDTMNIVFVSAIKGAGDTRFVMIMLVFISSFLLVIPTYLIIVVFNRGIMLCWVIFSIYVSALGFVFYLRFLGGKWKSMSVIEKGVKII